MAAAMNSKVGDLGRSASMCLPTYVSDEICDLTGPTDPCDQIMGHILGEGSLWGELWTALVAAMLPSFCLRVTALF